MDTVSGTFPKLEILAMAFKFAHQCVEASGCDYITSHSIMHRLWRGFCDLWFRTLDLGFMEFGAFGLPLDDLLRPRDFQWKTKSGRGTNLMLKPRFIPHQTLSSLKCMAEGMLPVAHIDFKKHSWDCSGVASGL